MAREYKIGESILFKRPNLPNAWGRVTSITRNAKTGDPISYTVAEDETQVGYLVKISGVVDLEQVAADASAALDRMARRDRERGDLLMHLLGRLSHYAEYGGVIQYHGEYSEDRQELLVRELVDEYTAKASAL